MSAILFGLAFVAFLWFAGTLAALREGGEQRLAAVAFGGGVLRESRAGRGRRAFLAEGTPAVRPMR